VAGRVGEDATMSFFSSTSIPSCSFRAGGLPAFAREDGVLDGVGRSTYGIERLLLGVTEDAATGADMLDDVEQVDGGAIKGTG
jgi:hypothetical protein